MLRFAGLGARPASLILVTNIASDLKNIYTAAQMFKIDKGRYPKSLSELSPNYLRAEKRHAGFVYTSNGKSFECKLNPDWRGMPQKPLELLKDAGVQPG